SGAVRRGRGRGRWAMGGAAARPHATRSTSHVERILEGHWQGHPGAVGADGGHDRRALLGARVLLRAEVVEDAAGDDRRRAHAVTDDGQRVHRLALGLLVGEVLAPWHAGARGVLEVGGERLRAQAENHAAGERRGAGAHAHDAGDAHALARTRRLLRDGGGRLGLGPDVDRRRRRRRRRRFRRRRGLRRLLRLVDLLLQVGDLLLHLAAVLGVGELAQVALVVEDGLSAVALLPERLGDVVEEDGVVLELVGFLPQLDRLVEIAQRVRLLARLEGAAGLPPPRAIGLGRFLFVCPPPNGAATQPRGDTPDPQAHPP